jgi:glutamine synthetase
MTVKLAEYIWVDGTQPTPSLRSKTRVLDADGDPPIWGFDGSSTNQAEGHDSDCVLKPVKMVSDPLRQGRDLLVLCEVLNTDMTPHRSNTRSACTTVANIYQEDDTWFGLEQEYTLLQNGRPLGFPKNGYPAPQGQYYCSVGATNAYGRPIAERHLAACLSAGLRISGINAEVCPGQWEFQVGPAGPVEASDDLWLARYLLYRIAEDYDVTVSLDAKPVEGDWNGSGCHTNFSTKQMRESYDACEEAAKALGQNPAEHIMNYGMGISRRLTGLHETCSYREYRWGVSDRGASVRVPWQVAKNKKGYIEDRRPNANCDPYVVTRLIVNTVCSK